MRKTGWLESWKADVLERTGDRELGEGCLCLYTWIRRPRQLPSTSVKANVVERRWQLIFLIWIPTCPPVRSKEGFRGTDSASAFQKSKCQAISDHSRGIWIDTELRENAIFGFLIAPKFENFIAELWNEGERWSRVVFTQKK